MLTISHTEPVGYYHFAHSFVRGSWRNEAESTFSLLAKCCHDVDLIASWMSHDRCARISSFGSLQHFRHDKKPEKAQGAKRCLDCAINDSCPYSATRLYTPSNTTVNHEWARHLVGGTPDIENVTEALRSGPYGRCVYDCDNDVCDHQVVNFEFASGEELSYYGCRGGREDEMQRWWAKRKLQEDRTVLRARDQSLWLLRRAIYKGFSRSASQGFPFWAGPDLSAATGTNPLRWPTMVEQINFSSMHLCLRFALEIKGSY